MARLLFQAWSFTVQSGRGGLLVVVEDSCLWEGRGRGGGDLDSFTGQCLARLISLIWRLSGLRLRAQRLKTQHNKGS